MCKCNTKGPNDKQSFLTLKRRPRQDNDQGASKDKEETSNVPKEEEADMTEASQSITVPQKLHTYRRRGTQVSKVNSYCVVRVFFNRI